MEAASITVRPLTNATDLRIFFRLATEAFAPEPSDEETERWAAYVQGIEEYRPDMLRGAFLGETLLGAYICYPRRMRIGGVLVPTGCIGAVVTDPTQRLQGAASAFLREADEYARQRGDGLMLLDGIPHFYHRFGYTKVSDDSEIVIARTALGDLPESSSIVRPAMLEDSAPLRDLYERAYTGTTGSFARSERQQHQRLERRSDNPPYVVEDERGSLTGYISLARDEPHQKAYEVIAADEAEIVALLRFHVEHAPEGDLIWTLPLESPVIWWLHDRLVIPGYQRGDDPRNVSAVTVRTMHQDNTAWMAKIVDLDVLQHALLPAWQRRWHDALASWRGTLRISVGELGWIDLAFEGGEVRLLGEHASADLEVRVTEAQFTRLVFGYRPVAWVARQAGVEGIGAARAQLEILFPARAPFIPASDGF